MGPWLALNPFADAILGLSLGLLIYGILKSIQPTIAKLPLVGGTVASAISNMARYIQDFLASIVSPASYAVGSMLHGIARTVDWTYQRFRAHAAILLQIASFLPPLAYAIAGWRALVHRLTVTHDGTAARVKTLEREYRGIEAQIKQLEKEYHGIDATGIRSKLEKLRGDVATIEGQTIPAIRGQVGTLDGAIGTIEGYLDLPTDLTQAKWAAGIVTVALGALGLGNLTCRNFGNLLNKWACGLGQLLDDLLGLVVAGIALEAVCDFLPLIETAFGAVVGPIVHLLNEVPLGSCEQVPDSWARLNVPSGPLPPGQSLGPFGG